MAYFHNYGLILRYLCDINVKSPRLLPRDDQTMLIPVSQTGEMLTDVSSN